MHIWDGLMHRKPELAWRGSTEQLGVGKPMLGEVLYCAEWVCPMATATTIQYQAPK